MNIPLTRKYPSALALSRVCFLCAILSAAWSPAATDSKHALWKAEGDAGAVYLLGSIHLLRSNDYPLPDVIEHSFKESGRVLFEVNLAAVDEMQIHALMWQKAVLPEGKTLEQCLSKETMRVAAERAKELGMDISAFSRFEPWFLAMTLSMMKMTALGFLPQYGVDTHFLEKAKKQEKLIEGLETVEFQLALFDELPMSMQDDLLLQGLSEMDNMESTLDTLVTAWKTGNSSDLYDVLHSSFKDYPELWKKLITDRNLAWVKRIEELLKEQGNTIVIVGAGHLVGDAGVVELLRKKGYSVQQL